MESLLNINEVHYSQILVTFLTIEDESLYEKTKSHYSKEKYPVLIKDIKTIDGEV